jgi:hypothetical protein
MSTLSFTDLSALTSFRSPNPVRGCGLSVDNASKIRLDGRKADNKGFIICVVLRINNYKDLGSCPESFEQGENHKNTHDLASFSLHLSPAPPTLLPEHTKPGANSYVYREFDFWTSGFFPRSLYLILERQQKHPRFVHPSPYSGLPDSTHLATKVYF